MFVVRIVVVIVVVVLAVEKLIRRKRHDQAHELIIKFDLLYCQYTRHCGIVSLAPTWKSGKVTAAPQSLTHTKAKFRASHLVGH